MNKPKRLTALVLTALMIIPLFSAMILPISAAPVAVLIQDFEGYADKAGINLTQEDGFGETVPYSTTPVTENGNTYLKMELASYVDGIKNPTDTVYYKRESNFALVEEGTEGAVITDRASYGLISGRDDNLDKNLIPTHPAVGGEETTCVILSVDYYLSEDAKGILQAQAFQYSSAEKPEISGRWLSLFRIDAETGKIYVDNGTGQHQSGVVLTKGEWCTVTVVIDTYNGLSNIFVDSALAVLGANLGQTKIEFAENSFIIGKVPRTTSDNSVASEELGGYLGIDNFSIYCGDNTDSSIYSTFDEYRENGQIVHVALLDPSGNAIKELPYTGKIYLNPLNGNTLKARYFSLDTYKHIITTKSESSLRLVEPGGIRFVNKLDGALYEELLELKKDGAIKDVSFGTLIAPHAFVNEARFFTIENLQAVDMGTVNYLKVEGTYGEWYNGEEYTFAGSISNIRPSHYDDRFEAVGYVEIRFNDNTVHYIYGSRNVDGAASMARLAENMLNSEEAKSLTANEIKFLKQFKVYDVDLGIAHISDVTLVNNELFFKTSKTHGNMYMSLSYSGNHGWRVKAARANSIGVESYGAAQALADYMGEDAPTDALPVTFQNNDGMVIVTAPDGSYVEIWYKIRFIMRFYSKPVEGTKEYPEGKLMTSIQEVGSDDDSIRFKGGLKVDEGVYGGGERFDNVNKTNKGKIQLYTRDGWNDSRASYLAIPLFLTQRGAGIYINRYEEMTAEFVSQLESYWEIDVKSHVMDCYIFTSGDMQDVLKGYSELTGYAEKPEEWAHGVMLCRYSSDLSSFENDRDVTNNDGAPSGRSVKTLVTNMINAGMKPASVIMEAWNYQDITVNTAKQDELRKTCEWLDEQGIKAMVYMRVANSFSTSDPGFKDEYFLHAWVTNDSGTVYTNQIPDTVAKSGNPDVGKATHVYIDITNPEAMDWYCETFWGKLLDLGVDGVKIDFCETMPDELYHYGSTIVDYDYYDDSKIVTGTEHHAYSTYFITEFYKRMNELKIEKGMDDGFVVLSRGGGIGSQRSPYLWAGDQVRAFTKLDDQIKAVINCGLSGVPFMTYDMAGYRYGFGDKIDGQPDGTGYADEGSKEYESAVFARAIAFTAFTSNIQTHGTVRNAYELTEDAQEIYRNYTALHEALTPYITELVEIACSTGLPPVRHPILHYQSNTIVRDLQTQFMLGDALMITPVLTEDPGEVEVYLPEGSWTNLLTGEVVEGDNYYTVKVNLGQIPVFLNNDSEDAEALKAVFEGEAWTAIKNFVPTATPEENLPEVTE